MAAWSEDALEVARGKQAAAARATSSAAADRTSREQEPGRVALPLGTEQHDHGPSAVLASLNGYDRLVGGNWAKAVPAETAVRLSGSRTGRSGPADFARRTAVTLLKLTVMFLLGFVLVWVLG